MNKSLLLTIPLLLGVFFVNTVVSLATAGTTVDVLNNQTRNSLSKQGFTQVGNAKFSVLFWDIYHSALYTPSGSFNSEISLERSALAQPLLFEIQYLRDISSEDLLKRTIEQWQHLGMQESTYALYLPKLKKIWPDIKKGDRLALLLQQDSTNFYFNERFAGNINHPLFGQRFLAIWLAENTSQPKLRRQLIGASN